MPASDDLIARFARTVARGDNSSSIRLPRAPQMTMHMGTLAEVDINTNTAHFQFNDPSGLIVPGVRVLQAYSATNTPSAGDIVWAHAYGTDMMIVGQHMVPTNLVEPAGPLVPSSHYYPSTMVYPRSW